MYSQLFTKSAPKKKFEISRKALKIFLKVYILLFLEFAPKKIFEISQKAAKNFFEGVFMIIFQNIHPEKGSKQLKDFKYFF